MTSSFAQERTITNPSPENHPFLKNLVNKVLSQISTEFPNTPFAVQYWTGDTHHFGSGTPRFTLHFRSVDAVRRILRDGGLGFAEAYMDELIDIDGDIQELIKLQYTTAFNVQSLSLWEKIRAGIMAIAQRNTLTRVRKNVSQHYDLGNDFYKLWLDPSMTYTCAYFQNPDDTLEQAQRNKHEHICRKLQLQPGMTLVDIGCGWGAMMFYAAENYGVHCTGYTISEEQFKMLNEEIIKRGLQDRVKVIKDDYRNAVGQYDRFVSIGMYEQVGYEYVDDYMDMIRRILKPGGVGVLHTIGYFRSKLKLAWVSKYIFPGGFLPTLGEIVDPMNQRNINPFDVEDLRLHYAQTLGHWYKRWSEHTGKVREMYNERFVRMWRMYLEGVATGFKWGGCRLYQVVFTNGLSNDMPRTRAYLYGQEVPRFAVPNLKD